MKILHLGKYFYPEMGGIENYTLTLAREFKRRGHKIFVIVSNTSKEFEHEKLNGIEVFRLPRVFYFFRSPFTSPFLSIIKKIKPDIVHLHVPNPWFELNLFFYCLFFKKPKIVITYHSDIVPYTIFHFVGDFLRKFYLLPLLKIFSKKIIATSENYVEGSCILKKVKHKIVIIPLGINPKKFKPMKIRKKKKKVLLFLGRLFPYKGLEYLLQAIKIVSKKRSDFILFIAGSGELRKKLEDLVKKLRISRFVKLVGKVTDEEAIKYYNLCDIFVLPSIYKSEAFGISMLEAMACAKPVISCDIKGSGVPWVNQHMKTGLIVKPKDPKALASAILYLLENKKVRNEMGKNARKRVLKYFTTKKMIREIAKVYKS